MAHFIKLTSYEMYGLRRGCLPDSLSLPPGTKVLSSWQIGPSDIDPDGGMGFLVEYPFDWCVERVSGSLFRGDMKGADYDFEDREVEG